MGKIFKFTGIICWIFLLSIGVKYIVKDRVELLTNVLAIIGFLALTFFLIFLIVTFLLNKSLFKEGGNFFVGYDLIKSIEQFLEELPKPSKIAISNLIGHLVYRFTRIGIIGLVIALIPITLLWQQNKLLNQQNTLLNQQNQKVEIQNSLVDQQNKLVSNQNKSIESQLIRIDQQTHLQEAERRSALVFLFSNILDGIDKELKENSNRYKRDLSPQLIGRIIALSNRLKPYKYLEGDSLIDLQLSPERTQLLINLVGCKLSKKTYELIFKKASFEYSDLRNTDLSNSYLKYINLDFSNLEGANLANSILNNASIHSGIFREANLTNTELKESNLRLCDFRKSNLENAKLIKSNLHGALLTFSKIKNTNMSEAYLEDVKFSWLPLEQINLNDAKVGSAIFDFSYIPSKSWITDKQLIPESLFNNSYTVERKEFTKNDSLYIIMPRKR